MADSSNTSVDEIDSHSQESLANKTTERNCSPVENCSEEKLLPDHNCLNTPPNNNTCNNKALSKCFVNDENIIETNHTPNTSINSLREDINVPNTSEEGCNKTAVVEKEDNDACEMKEPVEILEETKIEQEVLSEKKDALNGFVEKSNFKAHKSKKKLLKDRPRKTLVAMYHSQISGDKNTIKIRIKKSHLAAQLTPNKKKNERRKRHKGTSQNDDSGCETKRRRIKSNTISNNSSAEDENREQSVWGNGVPSNVLYKIFQYACVQDGCLPTLIRLCKVCKLWREVALSPSLWYKMDLNWVKDRFRNDYHLHWLILNRLSLCEELNLGEWKIRDIQTALEFLNKNCSELKSLNLSGWKGLNADNLKYLATEYKKLERLDLSSINSAINAQPFVNMAQTMNGRLTHLVLANNKIAGFTQIIASISVNCPNLQLLDISNIKTYAHNTALLHVEKLQIGCPNLRVLRITNSQIWLAPVSLTDQVASPGFPMLEELSLAGIEEDQTTTARSVDDDGIERILKTSTKLRLLDIRGCIRLSDSGLVKVPAWDLEHLFLSACYITRTQNSGLELILQKWSHSLLEVDLAWSTATKSLDAAIIALTEGAKESPLRILNLCGSSVSLEPVKAVLSKCPHLHSINLQSCRALPRGIKRLYTGKSIAELRKSLQDQPKTKNHESDSEQLVS